MHIFDIFCILLSIQDRPAYCQHILHINLHIILHINILHILHIIWHIMHIILHILMHILHIEFKCILYILCIWNDILIAYCFTYYSAYCHHAYFAYYVIYFCILFTYCTAYYIAYFEYFQICILYILYILIAYLYAYCSAYWHSAYYVLFDIILHITYILFCILFCIFYIFNILCIFLKFHVNFTVCSQKGVKTPLNMKNKRTSLTVTVWLGYINLDVHQKTPLSRLEPKISYLEAWRSTN